MKQGPADAGGDEVYRSALRASLVFAAVAVGVVLAWQLAHVLLLVFAAVLFAILLHGFAGLIARFTGLEVPWSLVLAGLLLALVAALFFFLLGSQIHAQISSLAQELPRQIAALGERLGIENLEQRLLQRAEQFSRSGLLGTVVGYTSSALGALTSLLLVLAAGIYLARHPRRYRRGVLLLLPRRYTAEADELFLNIGHALELWLLGQLVSMLAVGLLVTAGLYAVGMPSALALGFLAGIAEFVPIIGPALGFIPAAMLALSEGGNMLWWVGGIYAGIQFLESYLIMPLVQRKAVQLPPVLTLFAIVAFGVLFGIAGVLLATPLTVALYVAVKRLWVRDLLSRETEVPGDRE